MGQEVALLTSRKIYPVYLWVIAQSIVVIVDRSCVLDRNYSDKFAMEQEDIHYNKSEYIETVGIPFFCDAW